MICVFMDISNIKDLFRNQYREYHQSRYVGRDEFETWLVSALDTLSLFYIDFQWSMDNHNGRSSRREPPMIYDVFKDLHRLITEVTTDAIGYSEVSSCCGFIDGDYLEFQIEVINESCI